MKENIVKKLAAILREAYANRSPCAPLREVIGVDDLETAYAVQELNISHRKAKGARVVGRKIGLTSKVVQKQLGVDQPDFGILLDTMEVLNNDSISVKELMQPKAEGEIAFVLGKDLPQHPLAMHELISAIAYALPAIEIVGSRIENWNIKITDTIADNASASHFAVGHKPVKLSDFDMINCEMNMSKNGAVVSEGTGTACLGSPLNATLWLVNTMAKLGTPLKAGEVILSGALGKMVNIEAGDTLTAEFSDLGTVSVHFEA